MNFAKKIFCRGFQIVLRLALPILPYRDPLVLEQVEDIPACLKKKHIEKVLIVTDGFLHISGMLEPMKKVLKNAGIDISQSLKVAAKRMLSAGSEI